MREVPRGSTITYGDLGKASGFSSGSARFIGNTMRKNTMPLIVPCHRVLKSDGKLGSYTGTGGVKQKMEYLQLEGAL